MRITARQIEQRERQFPLFLLSVVLVLAALSLANLNAGLLQRLVLPLASLLMVVQTLRAMPPWRQRLAGVPLQGIYGFLGGFAALNIWIPYVLGENIGLMWKLLFACSRSLFLLMTAVRLVEVLARSQHVNGYTLCLGIAGYIHMGLSCGQLATVLQLIDGNSFRLGAISSGEQLITRLSYFAFVTLGTLGYGDVLPASPVGEGLVVLMSITSTLYLNLLIGLLLSRYINGRSRLNQGAIARPDTGVDQPVAAASGPRGSGDRISAEIQAREHRYPWFLAASLLPIVVLPFGDVHGGPLQRALLPLVATLLVLQTIRIMPRPWNCEPLLGLKLAFRGLGVLVCGLVWLPALLGQRAPHALMLAVLAAISLFYALTSVRILELLTRVEGVNWRTLTLAAAGYVQLGLTGGQIATLLALAQPGSFELGQIRGGEEILQRMNYYAFVTLGTIGYGDIVPTNPFSELLAIAISLTGTLYISLILGIILSRFINDQGDALFRR
ncbi:MAG: potassium channel family protein [Synechococcaceae cyanobacterium]|nr:potassium channel family protein [Synechococcaceae cyanobacterium]